MSEHPILVALPAPRRPAARTSNGRTWSPSMRTVQLASMIVIAAVIVSPLIMLFVASLKSDRFQILSEMGSLKAFWVSNPSLRNFAEVATLTGAAPFGRYLLNSLFILTATVVGSLLINSMGGFVLARGTLPGRALVLVCVIAVYVIPQESIVMPLLIMITRLGLSDSFTAQILPWLASPFYIFLFYQFFAQMPRELHEAAALDGASFFRIYRSIFLPLSLPTFATVSILVGVETWNQYLWPVLVSRTDYSRPISVAIASLFAADDVFWDRAMAASVLMMLPILMFYLVFQRWFVTAFISSAIKG